MLFLFGLKWVYINNIRKLTKLKENEEVKYSKTIKEKSVICHIRESNMIVLVSFGSFAVPLNLCMRKNKRSIKQKFSLKTKKKTRSKKIA